MEFLIKTIDELRSDRVRLEISGTPEEMVQLVQVALLPSAAEHVLDQAERASTVPALKLRIMELESEAAAVGEHLVQLESDIARRVENAAEVKRQLTAAQDARQIETNRADRAEAELVEVSQKCHGFDRDLRSERNRADANKEWAERIEALAAERLQQIERMQETLAQRQGMLSEYICRHREISLVVLDNDIRVALETCRAQPGSSIHTLTTAVGRVRDIVAPVIKITE